MTFEALVEGLPSAQGGRTEDRRALEELREMFSRPDGPTTLRPPASGTKLILPGRKAALKQL